MTSRYDDIINLPRHVSPTRQRMSMHDRAAQFAPFAALVGYDDAVAELHVLRKHAQNWTNRSKKSLILVCGIWLTISKNGRMSTFVILCQICVKTAVRVLNTTASSIKLQMDLFTLQMAKLYALRISLLLISRKGQKYEKAF